MIGIVFDDLHNIKDLDNMTGYYLDQLGEVYGLPRGTMSDDDYRQVLRTHRLSFLSKGEIHTISEVAKSMFKDDFQSVEEAWNNPAYGNEKAKVIVNLKRGFSLSPDVSINALRQVKAGGVALGVASLNTWGEIYEDNETWGEVYDKYKNWGEVYGYLEE